MAIDKMRVLLTGGAGYIGSHVALRLIEDGHHVVIYDNLSTGIRLDSVGGEFVHGDLADEALLHRTVTNGKFDAVMHFAASTSVPESVADPLKYYRNNVANTLNLVEACARARIGQFVLSSTAAVYGETEGGGVDINTPLQPVSPYGASKMMAEQVLADYCASSGMRNVTLRYFNVAGADPAGRAGQANGSAGHLIGAVCDVIVGRRREFVIFGNDYATPDGTCVRDFIHVSDIAEAHVSALDYLRSGAPSVTLNCGYGTGVSVLQVVEAAQRVSGSRVPTRFGPRRPGDVVESIALAGRTRDVLDWHPQFADLDLIVRTALSWESKKLACNIGNGVDFGAVKQR